MKLTKAVFLVAFSIIAVFLIVSASSIYISAEATARTVKTDVSCINLASANPYAEVNFISQGKGSLPSQITILNETFTLNPGQNLTKFLKIPINIVNMEKNGFPITSFEMAISTLIRESFSIFNLTGTSLNTQIIFPALIQSPVLKVQNESNGQSMVSLNFNTVIPVILEVANIGIYLSGKFLGNLTSLPLSGSQALSPGSYSLQGLIKIPEGYTNNMFLTNANFSLGSLYW